VGIDRDHDRDHDPDHDRDHDPDELYPARKTQGFIF
jgi:hypothetical protein